MATTTKTTKAKAVKNTTAAEEATDAVVSANAGAAQAAPAAAPQPAEDAVTATAETVESPPAGGVGEAKAEEAAVIAEALTPAGGSVEDVQPTLEQRPDNAEAGVKIGGFVGADIQGGPFALRVRALPPQGFRRAGRHWPAQEVEVQCRLLTSDQIAALLNEPMLHVTVIDGADGQE